MSIFAFLATFQFGISTRIDPLPSEMQPNNYTGLYTVAAGDVILTLSMHQDANNMITGKLESNNGNQFALEGMVSEGVAAGACSGSEGYLYFEAYLDGEDLTFSLIEPDEFNMPVYETAQYFVFRRGTRHSPQSTQQSPEPASTNRTSSGDQVAASPRTTSPAKPLSGSEVVRDELNGFSFVKPEGWVHQYADGQILLGSHTIPGLISVFPHRARNSQEMQELMKQGFQEEGVSLLLQSSLQQRSGGMITGTYGGTVQAEQARGHGIGLLSPHGGGVFVMAVSTPQKLGQPIMDAAEYIVQNTSFQKQEVGDRDLVSHFAGEWAWTNGYRTEWMTFYPDGTYSDQAEAGYSGNFTDGAGNVSGNWGVANENSNTGRWVVRGNRESGVITVVHPDGRRVNYEYSVYVERGKKFYREYLMNGYHYNKQKDF